MEAHGLSRRSGKTCRAEAARPVGGGCHPLSGGSRRCYRRITRRQRVSARLQRRRRGTSGEAAAILSAAREALGGEERLSSVKTIVASGRTRQVQGDNLVPIEFEITIELPDKYVRTDEIPARESGPNSRGFNGDGLIQCRRCAGRVGATGRTASAWRASGRLRRRRRAQRAAR